MTISKGNISRLILRVTTDWKCSGQKLEKTPRKMELIMNQSDIPMLSVSIASVLMSDFESCFCQLCMLRGHVCPSLVVALHPNFMVEH